MASGKSLELSKIPRRTPEWIHKHKVRDKYGKPQAANRAELRAIKSVKISKNVPYVKPEEDNA